MAKKPAKKKNQNYKASAFAARPASYERDYNPKVKRRQYCHMLRARELSISLGNVPICWRWTTHHDSRFSEVAELLQTIWLDIRGTMSAKLLSKGTLYSCYLVFKLTENPRGLRNMKASVRFSKDKTKDYDDIITLLNDDNTATTSAKLREDGWMEIELGEFLRKKGDGDEDKVEMQLRHRNIYRMKSGLIVGGIEVRSKHVSR